MKSSLNNYLQKKLTLSSKEAELIKFVYKQYIQEKKRNKYEEDLLDDAKDLAKKGISNVQGLLGKDKSPKEELDIDDKKARQQLFDSIISDDKVLSQMEEVGKFFILFRDDFSAKYAGQHTGKYTGESSWSSDIYGMVSRNNFVDRLKRGFNVPSNLLELCINYGKEFPVRYNGNDPVSNQPYLFFNYLKVCISYVAKDKFEKRLKQYIMDYSHISKNKNELIALLFTDIHYMYKSNVFRVIEKNFKEQVEDIKKEVSNIDRYKTRGETSQEKGSKIKNPYDFKNDSVNEKYSILNPYFNPSTLLKLYLHFYPNSNKFEFKDIFQFTSIGKRDDFISESNKSIIKKGENMKSNRLGKFLEKKLTISEKESQIIESVIKEYIKKKIKETGLNKAGLVRNKRIPNYDYETEEGMTSLDSNYSNVSDKFTNYPEELYSSDEEEDEFSKEEFYDRHPELPRPKRRK